MYLEKLTLTNFKNYFSANMLFSEKINFFSGDNGVGKTNILDAIYYLAFTKSALNPQDNLNINHNEEFFLIKGDFIFNNERKESVSCLQKRNLRKEFKRNKNEYDRLSEHIGMIPLVMVSPYDTNLVHFGSDERRKFIDGVISQFDKNYLDNLLNYTKAVAQRNALLKSFALTRTFNKHTLEVWSEKVIALGNMLYQVRRHFIEDFTILFNEFYAQVSDKKEDVSLIYDSQLNHGDFEKLLHDSLDKDKITQYTNVGVHKDDIVFNIKNLPLKKFGSQGQQKSYVIAIKLAQFEYIKRIKGYKPILLFDDIFDKLDNNRVEQIIKMVSENNFGQVFITDTQPERIKHVVKEINAGYKVFGITDGEVNEIVI